MTMTSTANTPIKATLCPTAELCDGVLKLSGSGNQFQLEKIVTAINQHRTEDPQIKRVEVDVSKISIHDVEVMHDLIFVLARCKLKQPEFSSSISGLTEKVLHSNFIRPFLKQIEFRVGESDHRPLASNINSQDIHRNFSLSQKLDTIIFTFTAKTVSNEDLTSVHNLLRDSAAQNVIIDLQSCALFPNEAVLAFAATRSCFLVNKSLKIIVEKNSQPAQVINDLFSHNPNIAKLLGEIVFL